MAQRDQIKAIRLLLFNDEKLKELMDIPKKDRDSVIAFRDKYCLVSMGTFENIQVDTPVRLIISWGNMIPTENHMVMHRPLDIEIWVQRSKEYGFSNNVFDRRQEVIADRLKYLICKDKIEHFQFSLDDMCDMRSNTQDYNRYFMRFKTKYIK